MYPIPANNALLISPSTLFRKFNPKEWFLFKCEIQGSIAALARNLNLAACCPYLVFSFFAGSKIAVPSTSFIPLNPRSVVAFFYTNFVGYSDVETKTKPNENTKYKIGSISKSFTSVLIMKAIEENKISLTTKINLYFPEIKNAEKITISNLLNHRSGIHNFTDDESYLTWLTQKKSEKDLVTIIKNGGSDFEPDSKGEYSNSNYVLLSFILEKVYEKSYSDILNEKIIKPIGLKNTFLGKKIDLKNNESNSYKYENGWEKEPETDLSIPIDLSSIVNLE